MQVGKVYSASAQIGLILLHDVLADFSNLQKAVKFTLGETNEPHRKSPCNTTIYIKIFFN
jgi:hypothetical protein